MASNLSNLGGKVVTRTIVWGQLCQQAWGSEFRAPDHGLYENSNGRKWDSTDQSKGGVYGITGTNYLMIEDSSYLDTASNSRLLQDSGDRIILE